MMTLLIILFWIWIVGVSIASAIVFSYLFSPVTSPTQCCKQKKKCK